MSLPAGLLKPAGRRNTRAGAAAAVPGHMADCFARGGGHGPRHGLVGAPAAPADPRHGCGAATPVRAATGPVPAPWSRPGAAAGARGAGSAVLGQVSGAEQPAPVGEGDG